MERTETPALWRKPPANRYPRSCGYRASALLCRCETSSTSSQKTASASYELDASRLARS